MDKYFISIDGMNFFTPDGKPAPAPTLPEIPEDGITTFEVVDNRAGRSAVAIALNHGNSNYPFAKVRDLAHLIGLTESPNGFQGIVFSDVASGGAQRFLVSTGERGPADDMLSIPDFDFNGNWHVFGLSNGKSHLGDYQPGDGFLMLSAKGSYVLAIKAKSSWKVQGGGGTFYDRCLREATRDAYRNDALLNLNGMFYRLDEE